MIVSDWIKSVNYSDIFREAVQAIQAYLIEPKMG